VGLQKIRIGLCENKVLVMYLNH